MIDKETFQTASINLRNPKIEASIEELLKEVCAGDNADLLHQMILTTLKLETEKVDRGDLKLLNTALKELRWAFRIFRPYRHVRKVTVFGSARIKNSDPIYKLAKRFAATMVQSGWMVITGASTGIMNAGNEGAGRAFSFGANIRLPFEQDVNAIMKGDRKLINFKYFFARKLIFIKESDAISLFPGGFGTLDEGFEALTLIQTGKAPLRPVLLIDHPRSGYWKAVLDLTKEHLLKRKMISKPDMSLVKLVTSEKEARDIILKFYKNYHSMRFVGERLILRLQKTLTPVQLKKLNREFKDIVTSGKIEPSGPLAVESNDMETQFLPRIVFYFDRRSFGRLKQMIDVINEMGD